MSADKSVSAILAATHRTDLLLIGCGIGLTLGVTAGILYPLPESSRVKSLWFKALLSVSGGLSTFVYALSKGAIDEMTILWVAGVAFAAPAAAEALHTITVGIANIDGIWQSVNGASHDDINAAIAAYVAPVPDLTPRQFKRFFVLSGLDVFIDQNLPALRAANPELYADVVSQLDGGTVYFYDVAESFMTQLLHILPNAPTVDFEQLKQLWIAQATHHIAI